MGVDLGTISLATSLVILLEEQGQVTPLAGFASGILCLAAEEIPDQDSFRMAG